MQLHHFSSTQITRIGRLIQKREGLLKVIDKIEGMLARFTPHVKEGRISIGRPVRGGKLDATRKRKGRNPGKLKNAILKKLTVAGSRGITVSDLSVALKVKPSNVFSWFYTTGKKVSGIRKVGAARYAYKPRN
jgi:hypothetical protein